MIELAKFLSIVATAVFGIIGSLVDFRKPNGTISGLGWTALLGVVISAVILASLQIYSEEQEEEKWQNLENRNALIIEQIHRSLHPIQELSVSYTVKFSSKNSSFAPYLDRLKKEVQEHSAKHHINSTSNLPQERAPWLDVGLYPAQIVLGNVRTVEISPDSPFFPSFSDNEEIVARSVTFLSMELRLYKEPRAIDDHPGLEQYGDNESDLGTRFVSELGWRINRFGEHVVRYSLHDDKLALIVHKNTREPEDWESRGTMVSQLDILGAQLAVRFDPIIYNEGRGQNRNFPKIWSEFELVSLKISLGKGFGLLLKKDNFEMSKNREGQLVYFFTFPSTMEQLRTFLR